MKGINHQYFIIKRNPYNFVTRYLCVSMQRIQPYIVQTQIADFKVKKYIRAHSKSK